MIELISLLEFLWLLSDSKKVLNEYCLVRLLNLSSGILCDIPLSTSHFRPPRRS